MSVQPEYKVTEELLTAILRAAEEECGKFAKRDIKKVLEAWLADPSIYKQKG